jgi:hypothetical protein
MRLWEEAQDKAFPNTFLTGARAVLGLIDRHTPNLTDENEEEIAQRWADSNDVSDSAIRTCSCGERLEGFYAYQDHLKYMIEKECQE